MLYGQIIVGVGTRGLTKQIKLIRDIEDELIKSSDQLYDIYALILPRTEEQTRKCDDSSKGRINQTKQMISTRMTD